MKLCLDGFRVPKFSWHESEIILHQPSQNIHTKNSGFSFFCVSDTCCFLQLFGGFFCSKCCSFHIFCALCKARHSAMASLRVRCATGIAEQRRARLRVRPASFERRRPPRAARRLLSVHGRVHLHQAGRHQGDRHLPPVMATPFCVDS